MRRSATPRCATTTRSARSASSAPGCVRTPGVSALLFRSLGEAGINIDMISTSEIRISVVTEQARLDDAVRVIHTAFGLDAEQTEAVVYGGTGR